MLKKLIKNNCIEIKTSSIDMMNLNNRLIFSSFTLSEHSRKES
jgi:hypothetical protein